MPSLKTLEHTRLRMEDKLTVVGLPFRNTDYNISAHLFYKNYLATDSCRIVGRSVHAFLLYLHCKEVL